MTFSALLMAGETDEARATGAELYDLALRLDISKLYTALDAMAFLACVDKRHEAAARILSCADAAHESHGQTSRRPVEARMRAEVIRLLDEALGQLWRARPTDTRDQFDEAAACSLALGLRA